MLYIYLPIKIQSLYTWCCIPCNKLLLPSVIKQQKKKNHTKQIVVSWPGGVMKAQKKIAK